MTKRKLLPIFIIGAIVIISIGSYFIFLKKSGPYADIAGEWQQDSELQTENETTKAVREIAEQLGESELGTLKIEVNGRLSLHDKLLNIKKDAKNLQMPKKRINTADEYPLEIRKIKTEYSPLFGEYLTAILESLAMYGAGSEL